MYFLLRFQSPEMQLDFTGSFLVNLFVKGGSPKFDGCLLWMKVRQRTVKQIKKGGVRSKYLIKSSMLQPRSTSTCRDYTYKSVPS